MKRMTYLFFTLLALPLFTLEAHAEPQDMYANQIVCKPGTFMTLEFFSMTGGLLESFAAQQPLILIKTIIAHPFVTRSFIFETKEALKSQLT